MVDRIVALGVNHLPIPSSLEDYFILELSVKFSKHGIETPCFTKTMVDMHNPVQNFAKTSDGVPNFVANVPIANVFALCIFASVFVVREEKRARGHKGKYQKFLCKRATRFGEKAMHKMAGAHRRGQQANKCKHMERSDIKTTTSMTLWRG